MPKLKNALYFHELSQRCRAAVEKQSFLRNMLFMCSSENEMHCKEIIPEKYERN